MINIQWLTKQEQIDYFEPFTRGSNSDAICAVLAIIAAVNVPEYLYEGYFDGDPLDSIIEELDLSFKDDPSERLFTWLLILKTLGAKKVQDILVMNPEKYIDELIKVETLIEETRYTFYKTFSRIA